jgi:hypothetical protein
VGCVQDAQIGSVAGSKVNGTIPVASVPAGSANYVQNTASQQVGSNFNITAATARLAGRYPQAPFKAAFCTSDRVVRNPISKFSK